MEGRFTKYFVLFAFFFVISCVNGFGEGTKELMPDETVDTRILVSRSSLRDPFAIESNTDSNYRLCIRINDWQHEKIYFGLGQPTGASVSWKIWLPDGSGTIFSGTTPASGQSGFINSYAEAFDGPNIINTSGYDAREAIPTMTGDYYMTFSLTNGSERDFKYFDITVVSDISGTNQAVLGRVFSKSWQIRNPQPWGTNRFKGKMFIYTNDRVVTRLDPNMFEGRDFSFACNESGCFPISGTLTLEEARQSQNSRKTYPEYRIFLNDPDIGYYPDGVIGQFVPPLITTPQCNTGIVFFDFDTQPLNSSGRVQITLALSTIPPAGTYTDKVISNTVNGGHTQMTWDGKDANGVSVPNNSTFNFVMAYTMGLTHLPLWDVEGNENGFKVNLIRPQPTPPLADPAFYWDDDLVGGSQMIDPPGCTIPGYPKCHDWSDPFGNERTINTWWFVSSDFSAPTVLVYVKSPGTLIPSPGNPPDVCQGQTVTFSVVPDQNSEHYFWNWNGVTQTTDLPSVTITFPLTATPGASHIFVNGMNADCPDGPQLDIPFTIHALPNATITGTDPVCLSSTQTYNTTATMNNYFWSVTGESIDVGQGTSQVTITWSTVGSHDITVTFTDPYGCGVPSPGTKTITVNPLPTATIGGTTAVCQNSTGPLITFTGASATTPPYTFTYNIDGGTDQSVTTTSGNSITVAAPTNNVGVFTYNLVSVQDASPTPCSQLQSGSAIITVNPLPTAAISGTTSVCKNSTPPQILFTGVGATAPYTFTYNINGAINQTVTTSVGNSVTVNAATNATGPFTYTLVSVHDGSSLACSQAQTGSATVTVNPLPTATISGTTAVCQNSTSPQITFTGGGATAPYTFTYNINSGANQTVTSVGNIVTVPAPTSVTGTFRYNLVSVHDGSSLACSQPLAGLFATVTVNSLPVGNISGTTSVCQNSVAPSITFSVTSPTTSPYIFTYNISGGANQTITTTSGNSIVVVAPTNIAGTFSYNLVSIQDGSSLACSQPQSGSAIVTVNPLPNLTIIPPAPPYCQDYPFLYTYSVSPDPTCAFTWDIQPPGNRIITPGPGLNEVQVQWITSGVANVTVTGTYNITGCFAPSPTLSVTVNPKPEVNLTPCFDQVTTRSARRFQLKGGSPLYSLTGIPLQGEYLVTPSTIPTPIQTDGAGNYYFNPSVISGNTTAFYSITYRYTNKFECPNTTSPVSITVQGTNAPCGATITDPRDSKTYTTALLAGHCWMTQNLNYSNSPFVSVNTPQTDNCKVEKYCPATDANCSTFGAYYQWDELVQYRNTAIPYQGVCPPGWHVPTETEWQTLIDNINPIFPSPSANATVGEELKDPASSFKALLEGIHYLNNNLWSFTAGTTATMFWTSTMDGNGRAIARGLNNPDNPSISKYASSPANAFPVRCVKDN